MHLLGTALDRFFFAAIARITAAKQEEQPSPFVTKEHFRTGHANPVHTTPGLRPVKKALRPPKISAIIDGTCGSFNII